MSKAKGWIAGLPVTLNHATLRDEVVTRVWVSDLVDAGAGGIETLVVAKPASVDVCYKMERDCALAQSQVDVLRNRGLIANVCPV